MGRFKMHLPAREEATPPGKRRIHWNIYGNWVGYVSGRRWKEFGSQPWAEQDAKDWLAEGESAK